MSRIARLAPLFALALTTAACGDLDDLGAPVDGLETVEQALCGTWYPHQASFDNDPGDDRDEWTLGSRASRVESDKCASGRCIRLSKEARLARYDRGIVDGRNAEALKVRFNWSKGSAEASDGFLLEYRQTGDAGWTELGRWTGAASGGVIRQVELTIDDDTMVWSQNFDIRFRAFSNSTNDHFFIDNVFIGFDRPASECQ